MGKSQTMVKNVVQESFFMEIFKGGFKSLVQSVG